MSETAEDRIPVAIDTTVLLPFAFAKRFGVLITGDGNMESGDDRVEVACKSQPGLTTLAELKRFAGRPLQLRMVGEDEFEALLTTTYSRDSSEAKQMVEDIGDEMDLLSLRTTRRSSG
jgi:general secretion pathway protein E